MLFRNLLLVALFIGMALSVPDNDEKKSKSKEVTSTVSLVALETIPAKKDEDDENAEDDKVEVIKVVHYIDATNETEAVETATVEEKEDKDEEEDKEEKEDKDEKEDNDEKEEQEEKDEKDEKEDNDEKEEKDEKDEKEDKDEKEEKEEKDEKDEKVEVVDDIKKILPESDEEKTSKIVTPVTPENAAILTEYEDTCTKDHIILGNHVITDVCDDLYDACSTRELLSIITYFYSKESPVSIEYTINEGMNKGSITEQCASVLLNSKIFFKETVVIAPIDEAAPVEKITQLYQDIPTQAPVDEEIEQPIIGVDPFAGIGEEEIIED